MSKLLKIMTGLAFVSVGLAAPVQADAAQDEEFYRLLTEPNQDHPMVIWDFPLVRSQGIAACQRQDAGETPYQAVKDLEYPNGPYSSDDANSITSTAEVIYCPWHDDGSGQRVDESRPVYPPPAYPPLAWYPPPLPPPPLPD